MRSIKSAIFFIYLVFADPFGIAGQTVNGNNAVVDNIHAILTRETKGTNGDLILLFFSGDGGWYAFESSIAGKLSAYGISTIGIDLKNYLWKRKSPEKASSDMAALMKYYSGEWGKSSFILMGYSQGAEIVPFIFKRLPDELKIKTRCLIMLSPAETTDFEVHISNMIGLGNKQNTLDVVSEISGITDVRQICIFGESESNKVPELLKGSKVEIMTVPGEHHYKSNTSLIVQSLKDKKAFDY